MDFAQVTLRTLEENIVERRKAFNDSLNEHIAEISNSVRGTSVSKFKVERLMKRLGEQLEHLLLTEIPQKQNIRVTKKLNKIFKEQTKEMAEKVAKRDEKIAELQQNLKDNQKVEIKLMEAQERLGALQQQEEMTKEVIKTNTGLQNRIKEFQTYLEEVKREQMEKDQLINDLKAKLKNIDKNYQEQIAKLKEEYEAKLEEKDQYWKLRVAEATVNKKEQSETSSSNIS